MVAALCADLTSIDRGHQLRIWCVHFAIFIRILIVSVNVTENYQKGFSTVDIREGKVFLILQSNVKAHMASLFTWLYYVTNENQGSMLHT